MTLPLDGMRICVLVSNDTSIDSRVKKECVALVEAGARVTLIGESKSGVYSGEMSGLSYELLLTQETEIPDWYARWGRKTVFYPLRVAVNLSLEPIRRRDFASARPWILKAVRGRRFDVVHANDFDMLATGVKLARRSGAKLVYDSHEIFLAPGRIDAGESYLESLQSREGKLFQQTSGFITVNPLVAEHLTDFYHPPVEATIIYNGADSFTSHVEPAHEPLRLVFTGSLNPRYHLPDLVKGFSKYRGKLTLTIFGFDGDYDVIKQQIVASGVSDIVVLNPPVDSSEIVNTITTYDIGLFNLMPAHFNDRFASPNKFFDYLAAGLAVVAPTSAEFVAREIEEAGCGYAYHQQSPNDVLAALDHLIAHPDEVTAMKRAALATAPRFSWDVQKKKLVGLYSSLRKGR